MSDSTTHTSTSESAAVKEFPYYIEGTHYWTNEACNQITQLVRSGSDARRLNVPIRYRAWLKDENARADEIERILLLWDDPSFVDLSERANTLVGELDEIFTSGGGTDMMDLGEIRVPLYALRSAISRRGHELRDRRVTSPATAIEASNTEVSP